MRKLVLISATVLLLLTACGGERNKPNSNSNSSSSWSTELDSYTGRYFRCYDGYSVMWCYEIDPLTATRQP